MVCTPLKQQIRFRQSMDSRGMHKNSRTMRLCHPSRNSIPHLKLIHSHIRSAVQTDSRPIIGQETSPIQYLLLRIHSMTIISTMRSTTSRERPVKAIPLLRSAGPKCTARVTTPPVSEAASSTPENLPAIIMGSQVKTLVST